MPIILEKLLGSGIMNISYVMKKCTKCGEWKVASTVNFYRQKSCKYGLQNQCKKCWNKQTKQWRKNNKNKIAEYNKRYHKRYYEANRNKKLEYQKQYCQDNKEKIAEYHKQWRLENKDKIAEYHKQWY